MTEQTDDITIAETASLLNRYSFELRGQPSLELIEQWLQHYCAQWIRLAVVEALYQGRYKAISVEHILELWLRRGQTNFHFTHEFERLICRNLPHYFTPHGETSFKNGKSVALTPEVSDTLNQWHQLITERKLSFNLFTSSASPTMTQVMPAPCEASEATVNSNALTLETQESQLAPVLLTSSLDSKDKDSQKAASGRSIHQFIPLLDDSELYAKLRAVVHQE